MWAGIATVAAIVLYLIGFKTGSDMWHRAALLVGIFGGLIPPIAGLSKHVSASSYDLPYGWVIITTACLVVIVWLVVRKRTTK